MLFRLSPALSNAKYATLLVVWVEHCAAAGAGKQLRLLPAPGTADSASLLAVLSERRAMR